MYEEERVEAREEQYRYEAFVSYRHVEPDYSTAKELHKLLEQFHIPASVRRLSGKNKMGKVFRDQEELPTSSDLGQDIENALRDSKWLIVVCSPRLPLSQWCLREIEFFIELGRRDRILTLLIEGEPYESFPEQLRFFEMNGVVMEREPLAADVRADSAGGRRKKLKVEKLRLLAPMLGVGFDDLRQRTRARFIRNVLTGTMAAAICILVFGGALFYQWTQARAMELLAASSEVSGQVVRSVNYRVDGQQSMAIAEASAALSAAENFGIDAFDAQAALYNAIVNCPGDRPYARLSHGGPVQIASFSRDGSRIATLSNYTTVTVWDTRSARRITEIRLPDDVQPIVFQERGMNRRVKLDFTEKNELAVMYVSADYDRGVSDNIYVAIFDDMGERVITHNTGMYIGLNDYVGFKLWDEAGIIAVSAMFEWDEWDDLLAGVRRVRDEGDEDGSTGLNSRELSEALWLSTGGETGKRGFNMLLLMEMETGDFYFMDELYDNAYLLDLSSDRSSLAALTLDYEIWDEEIVYVTKSLIFSVETMGSRNPDHAVVDVAGGNDIHRYLGGTTFIVANDEGIFLKDVYGEMTAIEGLEYPEDTNYTFVGVGRNNQFFAGYNKHPIWLYEFNGAKAVPVNQVAGFDYIGDGITNFLDWNEKDKGTVVLHTNLVEDHVERIATDGDYFYHDYMTKFYSPAPISMSSGTGILAVAYRDSSSLELYDLRTDEDEHYKYLANDRRQQGEPYIDISNNVFVVEGPVDGGYGFTVSYLEGGELAARGTVAIPGSAGFSIYDDEAAYYKIKYGREKAILLLESAPLGNRLTEYSIYALDYGSCTLDFLTRVEGEYLEVLSIMDDCFILQHSAESVADVTVFDYNGGTLHRLPDSPGNSYWNLLGASPAGKRIAWPYQQSRGSLGLSFGVVDLETGMYDDFGISTSGRHDSFFWASDGRLAYVFERPYGIDVFDMEKGEKLDGIEWEINIVDVFGLGGDLMAVFTSDNTFIFYDMLTAERIMESEPVLGDLKGVTYNPVSGLAAIATHSELNIYDIAAGGRAYGTILYQKNFDPADSLSIHITDDGARLIYVIGVTPYTDDYGDELSRYYSYQTVPLYTNKELQGLADEFR